MKRLQVDYGDGESAAVAISVDTDICIEVVEYKGDDYAGKEAHLDIREAKELIGYMEEAIKEMEAKDIAKMVCVEIGCSKLSQRCDDAPQDCEIVRKVMGGKP